MIKRMNWGIITTWYGSMRVRNMQLYQNLLPRKCIRENPKATKEDMSTAPTVENPETIKEFL
jgi:hypothetical protein